MVKRAAVIDKFIECMRVSLTHSPSSLPPPPPPFLCQHLSDLHAYNSLLAVVGGLNHFSLRRLAQTWAKVDKSKKEVGRHHEMLFLDTFSFTGTGTEN